MVVVVLLVVVLVVLVVVITAGKQRAIGAKDFNKSLAVPAVPS